jgi:hypothetical protein
MRVRPATLIGLLFAALGFGMAMAVDRGVTHDWPYGARVAWAVSLVVCALAGIITVLVSEGLVSNDLLEGVGPAGERSPNMAMFLGVYVGSLAVGIALAVILERQYGINAYRTILVYCGGFFLLGATGHPWWIFATLRRLGWFALIESDAAMRVVLGVLGTAVAAFGLVGRL